MQHSAAIDTSELPVESLSNVVRDAIEITEKLGFKYLWVNRYCINQHNSEEKHSQIRNMDSIYNTAELTIIAAVGDNPSFGLPGASSQRPRIPQIEISLGGIKYASVPPDPKRLTEFVYLGAASLDLSRRPPLDPPASSLLNIRPISSVNRCIVSRQLIRQSKHSTIRNS